MFASLIVTPLLLAIAAFAPSPLVQSSAIPQPRSAALQSALFESGDAKSWRFCRVGTDDCAALNEFSTCLLATGRCKADGQLQYASSKPLAELPVIVGPNP